MYEGMSAGADIPSVFFDDINPAPSTFLTGSSRNLRIESTAATERHGGKGLSRWAPNGGMLKGKDAKGFTVLEMLIVVGVIGLLTAIAVPSLVRARMAANEVSALASLRTINGAQLAYRASCGNGLYAASLEELGRIPGVGAAFIGRDLVPSNGPSVAKSGYEITLQGTGEAIDGAAEACTGSPGTLLRESYFASAAPLSLTTTGRRFFGTSERQTVFQNNSAISKISSNGRPSPDGAPVQTRESQEQLNEHEGRSRLYVD